MMKRTASRRYSLIALLLMLEMMILLPILALQYYNYKWNAQVVSEELMASAYANVSYLREAFSDQTTSIINQQEYLLTVNADVSRYLTYARKLSKSGQYDQEVRLLNDVKNICYANSLLRTFSLYYPTLNRQFSAGRNEDGSQLENAVAPIDDTDHLIQQFSQRKHVLLCEDGELFFIYGKSIGDGLPQYITKAVIDSRAIGDLLAAYGVYPSQKAYLIHWDSQFVISSDGSSDTLGAELAQWFVPQRSNTVYSMAFSSGDCDYTIFCADIPASNVTFIHLIGNDVLNAIPSRLRILIMMAIGLMLAVSLLYFLAMHFMVNRPVRELMKCFAAVGQGVLDIRMNPSSVQEFCILSSGYNTMAEQLGQLIEQNYQQTLLLQQSQLRQLHSQIEPHFLYNSFFMLRHAISAEEIETAEKICGYLGEYFRFITHMNVRFLPLREEYGSVMNYVAIQQMRFASSLKIDISPLPEELAGYIVPSLILQPLIENVIEHGVPAHAARMQLRFEEAGEDFLIRVEDDGQALSDAQLAELEGSIRAESSVQTAHALGNIHHRLRLFYGEAYGLSLTRSSLGGFGVTMRLQKRLDDPPRNEDPEEVQKHVP